MKTIEYIAGDTHLLEPPSTSCTYVEIVKTPKKSQEMVKTLYNILGAQYIKGFDVGASPCGNITIFSDEKLEAHNELYAKAVTILSNEGYSLFEIKETPVEFEATFKFLRY